MPKQEGPRGFEMRDDPPGAGAPEADSAQEFTFASLVLSLSTSALLHLGMAPRGEGDAPAESKREVNLPMARQVIDILEVLEIKTQGNLDKEEVAMLEQVLHDLHMRFVEAADES
jgi:hypothetical protein